MDSKTLNKFATRYTAAWCSQHAASVASFFEEQGSQSRVPASPRHSIRRIIAFASYLDVLLCVGEGRFNGTLRLYRGLPLIHAERTRPS